MKVTFELRAGPEHREPTKNDIDKNIRALKRAIARADLSASDQVSMHDTLSILEGIRRELPSKLP